MEFWNCGSKKKKKKGTGCPVGGTINHKNMVKVCTEVLGLDEFDEAIFLEKVDHIDVPERYTLEFHMGAEDGCVVTKACPNTGIETAGHRSGVLKCPRNGVRTGNESHRCILLHGRIKVRILRL